MGSEPRPSERCRAAPKALGLAATGLIAGLLMGLPEQAAAQSTGGSGTAIFVCTSAAGLMITADRYISACADREQRVLNRDGSLRMVVPPSMSPTERAAQMVREQQAEQARAAEAEQRRRDRELFRRYPSESAHQAARDAELGAPLERLKAAEAQRDRILKDARPLRDEAEFYRRPGTMPSDLKAKLDGIEASLKAVESTLMGLRADVDRVNQRFDEEQHRLQPLWAAAPPPRR